MKRLVILILAFFLFAQIPAYTESQYNLTKKQMYKLNSQRMTLVERFEVNVWINKYIEKELSIYRTDESKISTIFYSIPYHNTYEPGNKSIHSAIFSKKGDCQAYTFLFAMILDRLNIDNYLQITDDNTHIYNMVMYKGEYVAYDMTEILRK